MVTIVWVVSRSRLKAPPGTSSPYISLLTPSGQRNSVPTSEVGYTSATARRGDHESSYEHVVALKKNSTRTLMYLKDCVFSFMECLGVSCDCERKAVPVHPSKTWRSVRIRRHVLILGTRRKCLVRFSIGRFTPGERAPSTRYKRLGGLSSCYWHSEQPNDVPQIV